MAVPIKGDFGTKVNALVRFLLHQDAQHDRLQRRQAGGSLASGEQQLDDEAADEVNCRPKGLVYSQWETELVLVSKALTMNGIKYVELKGSVRDEHLCLFAVGLQASNRTKADKRLPFTQILVG